MFAGLLCFHRCSLKDFHSQTLFDFRDCLEGEIYLAGENLADVLRADLQLLGNIVTRKVVFLHVVHDGIGHTAWSS